MSRFETIDFSENLESEKKLYFASDFHLGAPSKDESRKRERRLIKWLEHIKTDASAIFLVGDIFDFWFEYKHTVPKGFIRFQGKLAELADEGIKVVFFSGNHDLWYDEYLIDELGISIYNDPIRVKVKDKTLLVGHGDGLGRGDGTYKLLKRLFTAKIPRWMFQWLHPNIGVAIATFWSRKSRKASGHKDDVFLDQEERLFAYSKEIEQQEHHDYYIFGHRHMSLTMELSDNSTYFNLGDWIKGAPYLVYDGKDAAIHHFDL